MQTLKIAGKLEYLWAGVSVCGEGPCWDAHQQSLYWVDIDGCRAYRYELETKIVDTWLFPEKIGWLLPCADRTEKLAGFQSGVYLVDLESGKRELVVDPEPHAPGNRLNDAKIDAAGRLWMGTMGDEEKIATGWLYSIDSDLNCMRWDGPYVTTNGPAISTDDQVLYHVDTHGRTIYAFDKHQDGVLDRRRIFAVIPEDQGYPDGLTVDTDGFVWLCHWGGYRITRFSPDGRVDGILPIPAPQVTSCAFGGPDMDLLFITTAARNIDLELYPKAGGLFCTQTKARGLLSPKFVLN